MFIILGKNGDFYEFALFASLHIVYHIFSKIPCFFFLEVLVHAGIFLKHFWFTPDLYHGERKISVKLLHIHKKKIGNHVLDQLKYQIP